MDPTLSHRSSPVGPERCERGWLFAVNKKEAEARTRASARRTLFRRIAKRLRR